jgi:predicted TIM-barrel fold metal-dependent hydrolase
MLTRREALIRAAVAGAGALVRGASVLAAAPQQTFRAASQPATPVNFAVPTGACDCHLHIIDPRRFPFAESEGRESASVEESRALHRALHIDRVVLIQSGSYGTDNSCLLDALRRLGSRARGVVVVTDKTSDAQLDAWDRAGVRGTRLSGGEGISASPDDRRRLQAAVQRLAGRRWHVNTAVQFPALEGLQDLLLASPVPVVIDHFAAAPASRGVRQPGFDVLLNLVRSGRIYLKLSREHNMSTQAPDYPDVAPLATALVAANPRRVLWATDWPHVNGPGGVDDGRIFNQFAVWVPDPVQRKTVLVDNPARLYGF